MVLSNRILIVLLALAVAAGASVMLYRSEPDAHDKAPGLASLAVTQPGEKPKVAPAQPVVQTAPQITADDVARWTADVSSGDAGKRAVAIAALANAPVPQALPVLRRVLMGGEPTVDRPLALRSLRDLALNNGDPNSSIRNTIREAIYHGDDQTMTADAQEALDVVEESLLK